MVQRVLLSLLILTSTAVLIGCGGSLTNNNQPLQPQEIVTPSGLRYQDYQYGTGSIPQIGDTIAIHYTAWLSDGTKSESTYDDGKPLVFAYREGPVQVIDGWNEALSTMRVGGKRKIEVPPELAYGADGNPPRIPPNATLVFYLELLEIRPYTVTPTGLRYEEIKVGDGATPSPDDTVVVHYTGWLTDGTKFDSSYDSGQPEAFVLSGLIEGWKEGLATMRVGGKRYLRIPPDLAYGAEGKEGIPPNSILLFEVELLEIKPPP